MGLMCKLFGHVPNFDYERGDGAGFLYVEKDPRSSTLAQTVAGVMSRCARCGERYRVGLITIASGAEDVNPGPWTHISRAPKLSGWYQITREGRDGFYWRYYDADHGEWRKLGDGMQVATNEVPPYKGKLGTGLDSTLTGLMAVASNVYWRGVR